MPRKRDPMLAVLDYFATADLALAQQTLAIVQHTLKRRQQTPENAKPRREPRAMKPHNALAAAE